MLIFSLDFFPKMLLKLKKDGEEVFNDSSNKMKSTLVASLLTQGKKITSLFFSYLEPYPYQNLVFKNSGMTM